MAKDNNLNIKSDIRHILFSIGLTDWNIVLRKLNKTGFWRYRCALEGTLLNTKVSTDFIKKYKKINVFPSLLSIILKNNLYSTDELINIIETNLNDISYMDIFNCIHIPLEYKKQYYKEIYTDFINNGFDINVSLDIKIKETKRLLSVLE